MLRVSELSEPRRTARTACRILRCSAATSRSPKTGSIWFGNNRIATQPNIPIARRRLNEGAPNTISAPSKLRRRRTTKLESITSLIRKPTRSTSQRCCDYEKKIKVRSAPRVASRPDANQRQPALDSASMGVPHVHHFSNVLLAIPILVLMLLKSSCEPFAMPMPRVRYYSCEIRSLGHPTKRRTRFLSIGDQDGGIAKPPRGIAH